MVMKRLPSYTCCVTSELSCWNDGAAHFYVALQKKKDAIKMAADQEKQYIFSFILFLV